MRFRILKPHAKGGLGQVSVAHDNELDREVALKEIQNRYASPDEAEADIRLYEREVRRSETLRSRGAGSDAEPRHTGWPRRGCALPERLLGLFGQAQGRLRRTIV